MLLEYKCKCCSFDSWDSQEDIEEQLWGHIQIYHKNKFEEVQNLETPDMILECYKEELK